MSRNPWEDRTRAIKTAKIARVLEHLLAEAPHISLSDLESADEAFRVRIAKVAQVKNPPSERTWHIVLELLAERETRA